MLKGQDVVLLLKLIGPYEPASLRDLAESLSFDIAGTHRATRRLQEAGLYLPERRRVPRAQAEEFLLHAVKFSFPAQLGTETRGFPTSWGAEPLRNTIEQSGLPPVWPHHNGTVRGLALEPLHPIVPEIAQADPGLWERLALVDALRSNGRARETRLAEKLLRERLRA